MENKIVVRFALYVITWAAFMLVGLGSGNIVLGILYIICGWRFLKKYNYLFYAITMLIPIYILVMIKIGSSISADHELADIWSPLNIAIIIGEVTLLLTNKAYLKYKANELARRHPSSFHDVTYHRISDINNLDTDQLADIVKHGDSDFDKQEAIYEQREYERKQRVVRDRFEQLLNKYPYAKEFLFEQFSIPSYSGLWNLDNNKLNLLYQYEDKLEQIDFQRRNDPGVIERGKERERIIRQRKEEEKRRNEEYESLANHTKYRKPNSNDYITLLKSKGITALYHFTDRKNIKSIKEKRGLLSWDYLHKNNIKIVNQGGTNESMQLDLRYGLEDYVRLSFCQDHPMKHRLIVEGADIILLRISLDVVTFADTLFSNMNATDSSHIHGGGLADLNKVNFSAVKQSYLSRDDIDFKYHQAEVMVKRFIPIDYIENIDLF